MIREYQESDLMAVLDLFYRTVHTSNINDYTKEQINAWVPELEDLDSQFYNHRFLSTHCYVDIEDSKIVAFGNIGYLGYLDCLYVDPDYQHKHIATKLCDKLESLYSGDIEVHASITAKPFFLKRGYTVIKEQEVESRGIKLTNYVMIKRKNKLNILDIHSAFTIRKLNINDLNALTHLCQSNVKYFSNHYVMPNRDLIIQSIRNNSEIRKERDFYSLGFFFKDQLVGVIDLTLDYPIKNNARLNFIILEGSMQNKSIGSTILNNIYAFLRANHYTTIDVLLFEQDIHTDIENFFKQNSFYMTNDRNQSRLGVNYRMELVL